MAREAPEEYLARKQQRLAAGKVRRERIVALAEAFPQVDAKGRPRIVREIGGHQVELTGFLAHTQAGVRVGVVITNADGKTVHRDEHIIINPRFADGDGDILLALCRVVWESAKEVEKKKAARKAARIAAGEIVAEKAGQ